MACLDPAASICVITNSRYVRGSNERWTQEAYLSRKTQFPPQALLIMRNLAPLVHSINLTLNNLLQLDNILGEATDTLS